MNNSKHRILLVCPKSGELQATGENLAKHGYSVLVTETGQEALRAIPDHLVHGVVLEYKTPFVKDDKTNPPGRTLEAITDTNPFLPLILLCRSQDDLSHAHSLMADMVLVHPVGAVHLRDALDTVLFETLKERARRKGGSIAVLR